MPSGPEGADRSPETPFERTIRETRENIRKVIGGIDSDASKSEDAKQREKESILRVSKEELKKQIEKHEAVPEDRRDDEKVEKDVMSHVAELAELVKNKVVPHLPEVAEAVVFALATKKFSKRKALLVAKIVGDIVGSDEFKATTEAASNSVKEKLRGLVEGLRGGGQNEVADVIAEQLGPPEPPKPPEVTTRGAESEDDPEHDKMPIEKYLDEHYRRVVKRKIKSNGEVVTSSEGWLDIEKQTTGGGYYGLSPDHSKSLLGQAIMNQIDLTRSQRVVIRAFDGGDEFRTYFRATRDMLTDRWRESGKLKPGDEVTINDVYKEMSGDIKEIVRELLSTLSGTVDQANSKESRYIETLVDRISRNIRTEITGDVEMDVPGTISLEGTDAFLPAEGQTSSNRDEIGETYLLSGGMGEYLVPRNISVSMSEALVDDLASTLRKLKTITFGFHNARLGAYSLGSHEDLGEQIKKDGVKPADLVWAFKKEADINLAYNLFIQSLQQLKAQTGRSITQRYGSMSKAKGLTEAEYRAWIQLLSLDDGYRDAEAAFKAAKDGPNPNAAEQKKQKKAMDRIENRKLRAIKMASGIAWGHSREAWGVLLDAKLLVKREGEGSVDKPYGFKQHYGGSQSVGIEKMLAELHPIINDERWGRDKIAPIWMAYQPRDLEAAHTGWKRKEDYSHTRLYDLYDKHNKAFYAGRTDDLADFDDEYVTAHEFANVTSLHMLRREGWRLRQYELYRDKYAKEAADAKLSDAKKHDYIIRRLMARGGPRLVKMYIDNKLNDILKADEDKSTELSRIKHRIHKGEHVEHAEEHAGREFSWQAKAMAEAREAKRQALERYYQRYIFDDLSKRFATSLIAFEQPRYMPKGEGTLYSALNSFIEKQDIFAHLPANVLQTEVYPIFIDAIHTVERQRWEQETKSKSGTEDEQIARILKDPTDLAAADFDDPETKAKLKMHYKLNSERMGAITEKKHTLSTLDDLDASFEEYYKVLRQFHAKLIHERDRDRYNRVSGRNKRKESLAKRYAHMLAIDQGGINQALGGSYFDFSLEIQQGGVDAINRLSSDVVKSKKMTEAWSKLVGDGGALEKFAMAGAIDEDAIKHGAEHIAEAIEEVAEFPHSFSPEMGHEYKLRHEIFWGRAFARPDVFRGGLGPYHEFNWKLVSGGQTTLFSEYYQRVIGRRDVTSLDGDQLRTFLNACEDVLRLPPSKFEAVAYESIDDMGLPRRALRQMEDGMRHIPLVGPLLRGTLRGLTSGITETRAKKFHAHPWYQDMALRELRARKRDVIREKAFSLDSLALAGGILFGFAKSATEIDSISSGGGGGGKKGGGHGH